MFEDIANAISPGIGSVISGGLGFLGQMDTNAQSKSNAESANAFNANQAQINRDYQTEMSNSAYQRQVVDMEKAGLNPMLAYMKGGGASSPSGSTASATTPQYTSPIQGAAQYKLTSAQSAKTEAEKPKVIAETANISKLSEKIDQEISSMKTDQQKSLAVIDNLRVERDNLIKSGLNLTEVGNQLRAQVTNLKSHSQLFNQLVQNNGLQAELQKLDVDAAKGVGNIGREYQQLKPIIDLLKAIFLPRGVPFSAYKGN